ncbi:MAG: TIGR04282 family arsenosugar biosynthesis glycosyltransferase [Pseudomonadota bacterium]
MNKRHPACVQVFAKCPLDGNPKTRLQPPLSPAQASDLHRRLLLRTLLTAIESKFPLQLWVDQPSEDVWLRDKISHIGCEVFVQNGDTLGERMHSAIATGLGEFERAVIVGSDCPVLTATHIQLAVDSLSGASKFVFAPTEDGGYALVGSSCEIPTPFRSIDWGSNAVMAQTRAKLESSNVGWQELETLWDVDRPEDLARLDKEGIALPSLD